MTYGISAYLKLCEKQRQREYKRKARLVKEAQQTLYKIIVEGKKQAKKAFNN